MLDPGESQCYPYSFPITPFPGATGYQNDARATITNDPREPGDPLGPRRRAPFTIPASPTLVNDSVNVERHERHVVAVQRIRLGHVHEDVHLRRGRGHAQQHRDDP